MSYRKPTPTEIKLSNNMQGFAKRIKAFLVKKKLENTVFFFFIAPDTPIIEEAPISEQPIASYVSNAKRKDIAVLMMTILMRWEIRGQAPPIHELVEEAAKREGVPTGKPN